LFKFVNENQVKIKRLSAVQVVKVGKLVIPLYQEG
jgi:hypothetical protein